MMNACRSSFSAIVAILLLAPICAAVDLKDLSEFPPSPWLTPQVADDPAKLAAWCDDRQKEWPSLALKAGRPAAGLVLRRGSCRDPSLGAGGTMLLLSVRNPHDQTVRLGPEAYFIGDYPHLLIRDSEGKIVKLTPEGIDYYLSEADGGNGSGAALGPGEAIGQKAPIGRLFALPASGTCTVLATKRSGWRRGRSGGCRPSEA